MIHLEYAEYTAAMLVAEEYRKKIMADYNRGERIICRSIDTDDVIEVTGIHKWRWDLNDYFLGEVIPLTDKDAAVWPRLRIMVRNESGAQWSGPYEFMGVDIDDQFVCPSGHWNFARLCTKEEGL